MTDASGDDVLTSWGEPREEPFHRFGDATAAAYPVRADRSSLTRGFAERIDPQLHNLAGISQNRVNGKVTVTATSPRYVCGSEFAPYIHSM